MKLKFLQHDNGWTAIRDWLVSRVTRRGTNRRIFIATWREGNNFGDDYLSAALKQYLRMRFERLRVVETNLHLDQHRPGTDDLVILGGGGLWGPSGSGCLEERLYTAWMKVESPLIVANVGIESLHESSAGQLRDLYRRSLLFSLRDRDSWLMAGQILGTERIFWGADNTYLWPRNIRRKPRPNCLGINVCGPEADGHTKPFSITRIVETLTGLKRDGYDLCASVFTYAGALSDYPHCRRVDPSCRKIFFDRAYRRCAVFIGMRFHSLLLAMQNAIPVIALNYSDKVRRLMREYDLEEFCLEPDDPCLNEKLRTLIPQAKTSQVTQRLIEGNRHARQRLTVFGEKLAGILDNSVDYARWKRTQSHETSWWTRWLAEHPDGNDDVWLKYVMARFEIGAGTDFSDAVLVDVGGGPIGLMTKLKARRRVVIDPLETPSRDSTLERIRAMGERIPLDNETADAVFLYNVLQHVQSPPVVLAECVRIAKPGAVIYILEQLYLPTDAHHPHCLTESLFEQWKADHCLTISRWTVSPDESFAGSNRPGEAVITIRAIKDHSAQC